MKTKGDLTLYDYSKSCTYERAWNDATRIARGLVLDIPNKEVVALPFEKFYNQGDEHELNGLELGDFCKGGFFEKMDGSCVIIYFYNGEWCVNTRGSFDSDQAIKGKELLDSQIDTQLLMKGVTYICEVIYKDNKIVVNYGDREGLVLTGKYYSKGDSDIFHFGEECLTDPQCVKIFCELLGFQQPQVHYFGSIEQAKAATDSFTKDEEGFVYRSGNGVRVKIKGDEYCRVHGLISYHTPLFLWREFVEGGHQGCQERKKDIPEELWDELEEWLDIFEKNHQYVVEQVKEQAKIFAHLSNKELGLEMSDIKQTHKGLFFSLRNDKQFGTINSTSHRTICNMFEPTNNTIKELY
jgi:RNA ligase